VFPWSSSNRRSTAKSRVLNLAAGVAFGVLSYFGWPEAGTKHQLPWAIMIGVFITVLSFFMYRWRTTDINSDPPPNLPGTNAEKRQP
jgi:phosphotransferase system  glucose/maltose/N-acetylglucosamine-specific IIC component